MSLRFDQDAEKAQSNLSKHQVSFEEACTIFDDPMFITFLEEYDFAQLPILPKDRYAPEHRFKKNIVALAPDVAQAFPDDAAVNDALRLVLQLTHIPQKAAA